MQGFQQRMLNRPAPVCLEHCESCGSEIPVQRREALKDQGCTQCVYCQSRNDLRRVTLYGC